MGYTIIKNRKEKKYNNNENVKQILQALLILGKKTMQFLS